VDETEDNSLSCFADENVDNVTAGDVTDCATDEDL
jgi:hypothetical protein